MPEVPLGIWRHWKGGDYEVIVVAVHADTAEPYVVYRNPKVPCWVWTRTVEEFLAGVQILPDVKVSRFSYVGPSTTPAGLPA